MRAIQLTQNGGPEVLHLVNLPEPRPKSSDVLIANRLIGVNYVDTYYRSGAYSTALPFVPGMEGVGTVLGTGDAVHDLRPGDQVAYAMQLGAYSEQIAVPRSKVWRLPDGAASDEIAVYFLQGLTAVFLSDMAERFSGGGAVAVRGAGSGVGNLLVQILKRQRRRVFASTRSSRKADLLRGVGAEEVFSVQSAGELARELRRRNIGVDVLYDSVGGEGSWDGLSCLRNRGLCVMFGQSAGPAPLLDPQALRQNGSLFVTRPSLTDYLDSTESTHLLASRLHALMKNGVQAELDRIFPLSAAAEAHRWLACRLSIGKVLLQPD